MQGWVILKNMQFKHINLCANEINDDVKDSLSALLRRTNDEFGVTLAGNPITTPIIEGISKLVKEVHAQRVGAEHADQ